VISTLGRFFHYAPSIPEADAIGYSVRALHDVLCRLGQSSFMFCQDDMRRVSVREACGLSLLLTARWRRDDILILHHSFFNVHLNALLDIPIRKVLVYHNITPGHFFREANMTGIAEGCDAGRVQLFEARNALDLAVGVSEYNTEELRDIGYRNCHVVPVFYDDSFFGSPVTDLASYFEIRQDRAINVVFIGRLVPNKRPDRLLETVAEYKKLIGRPIHLHLVGKIWDEGYTADLLAMAARLGVLGAIRMHIAAPRTQVKTLLAAADAFVSFSEHEGLMVPLIEAFTVGCPVIAYRAAAIPETMGGAGVGMDEPDPALAAGLIELLRRDRATRREIIEAQSARAMHFRSEIIAQRWIDLLDSQFGTRLDRSYHDYCI
jgi:glycosyltransferase involved in cell wall biosynthesis